MHAALDRRARAAMEEFAPDWVLVSCGFDAHRADPLAQLALSSGDFADLARLVRELAPPGRLALFLEGGYDASSLASSVEATLAALLDLARTRRGADLGWAGPGAAGGGGRRASPRSRGPPGLSCRAGRRYETGRWTRTGQWALVVQNSLTEPSSMPTNSPWPRLPMTRRSAPLEASTSDGGRVAVDHPAIDRDVRVLGQCGLDRSVERSGGRRSRGRSRRGRAPTSPSWPATPRS